jgi:hypothetical protein
MAMCQKEKPELFLPNNILPEALRSSPNRTALLIVRLRFTALLLDFGPIIRRTRSA